MQRVVKQLHRRIVVSVATLAAFALLATLASQPALAVVPTPVEFELQISPYARVLDAVGTPQFMDVLWEESCDNPHLRVRARNAPALMLTNDSTSDAPITSFTLSINAGDYMFGTGDPNGFTGFIKDTIYTDAGVSITGSSVSPDGKDLTVNFSGLEAGKKVIFNVDFDAQNMAMFPFPDYRNILFGAPLGPGDPATTPGSYAATFTDLGSLAPNSQTLSGNFDQVLVPPTYQNEDIRPYREMDKVEITVVGEVIPEPNTALLAVTAVAALAALRRKRIAA
ncbi:MAG: hypothetical protein H0T51_07035 [Pirellulales bacterium]|nr:hypothetical protein [Pirellulales bacterium]